MSQFLFPQAKPTMTTSFRFFTVDAFATHKGTGVFTGNPAGVILIPKGKEISEETMQNIAGTFKKKAD